MSDTQKTLSPEESYNVLVAQVHAPVFFSKLASVYGITPQTPDEARELLLMASQLRNAHEQDNVKAAGERQTFFAEARQDLSNTLVQRGYQSIADQDGEVKRAAAEAARNPLIKEAALVFGSYLAQAMQAK